MSKSPKEIKQFPRKDKRAPNIWQILITGVVQSVGFRPFVKRLADKMTITGYVRNLGDAGVEIVIDCSKERLNEFIINLQETKPELSIINEITVHPFKLVLTNEEFLIDKSLSSKGKGKGVSALPPDIAICNSCIQDLKGDSRRIDYPFTSCTNCGPRYSAITSLPYDRPHTSFNSFPLCKDCLIEYKTSSNRRFHAQTTCCKFCGPKYTAYSYDKKWIIIDVNWCKITETIRNGSIWAVMGSGGTHFVLNGLDKENIEKLRKSKRRKSSKPFAVMMPDISTVAKYCYVTEEDKQMLTSIRRPIVILESINPDLWKNVSPGLDTLGVMLPYNGMHYNLFRHGAPEVIIMTSANKPGIPMPIASDGVLKVAKGMASHALVHNRKIIQRIDDSVIRSHGNSHLIVRRSRGYTPQPFFNKQLTNKPDMIAVGAEETNTVSIMKNGWIIPSQHLGHVINVETLDFQKKALDHLIELNNLKPEIITRDLHPQFHSSLLADELADKYKTDKVINVQHHIAHAASLALDSNWDQNNPILCWVCDGYGYGTDGQAWGGELIAISDNKWSREASMIPINYDGGDANSKYPARMLVNYLNNIGENSVEILKKDATKLFSNGELELNYLANKDPQIRDLDTTSMGRLFDAVSILLGLSDRRTYRGEPAIKLEALGAKDSSREGKVFITTYNGIPVLDNINLFQNIFSMYKSGEKYSSISRWFHNSIGMSMAEIGAMVAENMGIKQIGFSGGVAYNRIITKILESELKNKYLELIIHKDIPPGDAGISSGQIYFAGITFHG